MEKKKGLSKGLSLCLTVAVCCIIMLLVDGYFVSVYAVKSFIKAIVLLAFPIMYLAINKIEIKSLFKPDKKCIIPALLMGVGLYVLIVGAYLLTRNIFDYSNITSSLTSNIAVNKDNFVYVSLYISFVNSLLEEFFFRGFAFLSLKKITGRRFAYIFSALAFAIYHVAMMTGWFSIYLFALVMVGLFAGGLIFNYLNEKYENIYASWFVHMFANFAINTIGFILFGII